MAGRCARRMGRPLARLATPAACWIMLCNSSGDFARPRHFRRGPKTRCCTVIIFVSDWQEIEQRAWTSSGAPPGKFRRHARPDRVDAGVDPRAAAAILTAAEVEASFAVMGLDSQLIEDGTYFVVEADGVLAGCGGWSRRATLFGGNHSAGARRAAARSASEAARVRAMYTDPGFVRRGIGRKILALCEDAARGEASPSRTGRDHGRQAAL